MLAPGRVRAVAAEGFIIPARAASACSAAVRSTCSAAAAATCVALSLAFLALLRLSAVTASRRYTSAFQSALVMPGGLDGGALCFLCFGWAAAAVVSVAARGNTYFFGGMEAGLKGRRRSLAGGMENEREAEGEAGGNGGKRASSRRQSGPTPLFAYAGAPMRHPDAWVRLGIAGSGFGPR